jgi:hypothetical protein
MRLLNRVLGAVVATTGLVLTGWAPGVFTLLTQQQLPPAVSSDSAAMAVWSGVAFVRVFGGVLFGVGAVLWVTNASVVRVRAVQTTLFFSFALATAVVAAQQIAIWTNGVGWALAGLFAALAIATGVRLAPAGRTLSWR